jgi:hypothetical protein
MNESNRSDVHEIHSTQYTVHSTHFIYSLSSFRQVSRRVTDGPPPEYELRRCAMFVTVWLLAAVSVPLRACIDAERSFRMRKKYWWIA